MQIFWIFTPNHQIVLVLANFIKPNEIYKKKTNKILTHFLTIISDLKKPWAELRPLETDHGWGPTSHYIWDSSGRYTLYPTTSAIRAGTTNLRANFSRISFNTGNNYAFAYKPWHDATWKYFCLTDIKIYIF